jgi:hypothetical protein
VQRRVEVMKNRYEAQSTFTEVTEENSLVEQPDKVPLEHYLPDEPVETHAQAEKRQHLPPRSSLRSARIVALDGRRATIVWRGHPEQLDVDVATDVDVALLELAQRNGDSVFVEGDDDKLLIVGVMQTRLAREVHIAADKILLDAAQEIVIRAGRAAIRLREDGDVELVGSRISAASRGLFRLVGRILRLN